MKPELVAIFTKLSRRLKEFGESQNVSIDGENFNVYELSELSLQTEIVSGREIPSGISFEVFNEEMFLTPDGSISVSDESEEEMSVFSLSDDEMIDVIHIFLKWRLYTISKLKI